MLVHEDVGAGLQFGDFGDACVALIAACTAAGQDAHFDAVLFQEGGGIHGALPCISRKVITAFRGERVRCADGVCLQTGESRLGARRICCTS